MGREKGGKGWKWVGEGRVDTSERGWAGVRGRVEVLHFLNLIFVMRSFIIIIIILIIIFIIIIIITIISITIIIIIIIITIIILMISYVIRLCLFTLFVSSLLISFRPLASRV